MKFSLFTSLALVLTLVLAGPLFLLQTLVHQGVESRFKDYLNHHLDEVHHQLMQELESSAGGDGLDAEQVARLGQSALKKGLLISVFDPAGNLVFSPQEFDPNLSQDIIRQLESNQAARYPGLGGQMVETSHPIYHHQQLLGTMKTLVHTPWNLSPEDVVYLNQMDGLFGTSALAGVGLALALGLIFARALVRPLRQMAAAAKSLSSEQYQAVQLHPSRFKEIFDLQASLSDMRDSLQTLKQQRRMRAEETAHELRTPLANLRSQLEALEDGLLDPAPARFAAMKGEIERLVGLVKDWETLDEVKSGQLGLQFVPVDLHNLGQDLGLLFAGRFAQAGQTWHLDCPAGLTLNTDSARLKQILVNLIENAHRYSGSGTRITFQARTADNVVELTLADNGTGIPAADLPLVTQRLYRGEASRNRESGGAGLGLAVATALTEALGGRLELDSAEGQGTRCRLRFGPP